jgi:signal transduction histidine kinase
MTQHSRRVLLIQCLVLIASITYAQVIDSKTYDKNFPIVTKYVSVLKTNNLLSLDSVITPGLQNKFKNLKDEVVIFEGYNSFEYWFRFVISNTDSTPVQLVLLLGPTGMKNGELFQGKNSQYQSLGKTGHQYSFISRPYQYMHYAYPITLQKASLDTFYLRMDESHDYKSYGFAIMLPQNFENFKSKVYFYFGIVIGLLFLFFAVNIYLFFALKDKVHFWYSLYVAFLILIVFKNDQLDEQFLGFDNDAAYRLTSILAIGALAIGVLLHVVQLFLINIKRGGLLYRVTLVVKWNLILSFLIQSIVFFFKPNIKIETFVFNWTDNSSVVGVLFVLINCIVSLIKGYKAALFLLVGQLVFLAGALQRLLLVSTFSYMFPPSIFHIGMILETIIISSGLIYKYSLDRKEKLKLDSQLQSQKIEEGLHIITAQEEERKRIAEDLHDELGSSLAAAKIFFQNINGNETTSAIGKQNIFLLLDKAIKDVRRIAHNLMPPEFSNSKLNKIVESYFEKIHYEKKTRMNLIIKGETNLFSKQEELFIYRIILELAHNIIDHAGASEATIQLLYYEDNLKIMAEDNGVGFNQEIKEGIGLRNIKSRVVYLNGSINIDSNDHGTTIFIIVPIKNNAI